MFSDERLRDFRQSFPSASRFWIAFSGGLDSVVLAHALEGVSGSIEGEIRAIHCNHGLQPEADDWARWCTDFCAGKRIPCEVARLELVPSRGQSLEAQAREARYAAISARMVPGDVVLTAHHGDDQVETVLLQLLRGSGLPGLSGMPRLGQFPPGFLFRPLLDVSRADLEEYARENELRWIEDASNGDLHFDRNFLRHQVLPTLKTRWPGLLGTVARSARHCAEAQALIDELALRDLAVVSTEHTNALDAEPFSQMSENRRRCVLRAWFRRCGVLAPPKARLDTLLSQLFTRDVSPRACVTWDGNEVRRYRDRLYLLKAKIDEGGPEVLSWNPGSTVELPNGLGQLHAVPSAGRGMAARYLSGTGVEVRFRRGGERCRSGGGDHSVALKRLFLELGIPPWERARIPLVFVEGALAAVADLHVCAPYMAREGEPSLVIRWDRRESLPCSGATSRQNERGRRRIG